MELSGFALRDVVRRAVGRGFDTLGWGPRESPSRLVFREPGVRLKTYGDGRSGPVLVLVPAPIKRAYIWDLAPHCSVVRQALGRGCRVFLVEWEAPGTREDRLADYADRLLGNCLDAIASQTGERRVFLAGHSLGGTLAAIFATLHPERLRGLILLAAPVHFGHATDVFAPLAGPVPLEGFCPAALPGSYLNAATFLVAPFTIGYLPWLDRLSSAFDEERADTMLRVERWAHDEMPMSGRLLGDVVRRLFRQDGLLRGTLDLGRRRVAPRRFDAPLLAVVDQRCAVVPPASVEPFLRAVGSADTQLMYYEGDCGVLLQHVGMLVGRSAHRRLWPRILDWIEERAGLPDRTPA